MKKVLICMTIISIIVAFLLISCIAVAETSKEFNPDAITDKISYDQLGTKFWSCSSTTYRHCHWIIGKESRQ